MKDLYIELLFVCGNWDGRDLAHTCSKFKVLHMNRIIIS